MNIMKFLSAELSPIIKQHMQTLVFIGFLGGGVDTQKVLPFGTPAQVREQVLERCKIFAKNGGFVFDAIHNVQARTPVANVVAMIEAVHEFNG